MFPPWVADELGLPAQTKLTFEPNMADPDAIMVAHGSPTLDAMVNLVRRRGTVSTLFVGGVRLHRALSSLCTGDPWTHPAAADTVWGALAEVCFLNAQVRHVERRVLYQEELVFHFKVAYVSDERFEEVQAIAVDPLTEEAERALDLSQALMVNLPGRRHSRVEGTATSKTYVTQRMYQIACERLEEIIRPQLELRNADVRQRLQAETARIHEYYHALATESMDPLRGLLRRIAQHRARTQLLAPSTRQKAQSILGDLEAEASALERAYWAELGSLETEQERRLSELQERYRVRVEVELTHAALVRTPRLEWSLRLLGPTRGELTFLYDLHRDAVVDLDCDTCGEPLRTVLLCSCSDCVCSGCYETHHASCAAG